jgi:hypothetical protein
MVQVSTISIKLLWTQCGSIRNTEAKYIIVDIIEWVQFFYF